MKYQGDLIFSKNLSFIPVDLRYGPDGGMYVCDWYNPIKGHAQYSLRDKRRDRIAGRIFRILPKWAKPQKAPRFHGASISELLEILKRPEYRYRYWAKRELREKDPVELRAALDKWVANLDSADSRYRHTNSKLCGLIAISNLLTTSYLRNFLPVTIIMRAPLLPNNCAISLPDYREKRVPNCFVRLRMTRMVLCAWKLLLPRAM